MLIGDVWLSESGVNELAKQLGVHRTTAKRWLDRGEFPPAVNRLLRLLQCGQLHELHESWHGWSIDTRRGDLVSPVGDIIRPGHIIAMPYRMHQLASVIRQLDELRAELDRYEAEAGCPNCDAAANDRR